MPYIAHEWPKCPSGPLLVRFRTETDGSRKAGCKCPVCKSSIWERTADGEPRQIDFKCRACRLHLVAEKVDDAPPSQMTFMDLPKEAG